MIESIDDVFHSFVQSRQNINIMFMIVSFISLQDAGRSNTPLYTYILHIYVDDKMVK